jgi:tetratricopeptide (TPR) repeat protein
VRRPRLRALAAAVLLVPAAAAPAAAQAPPAAGAETAPSSHPFYVQLLDDGVFAYQRGDHEQAARDLRLAVFGLLEEPPRLVRGLAYLALAQAAGGETEAARETIGRLLGVEERFRAWTAAELPDAVREGLEALLLAEVPEATLAASPTFRHLGDRKFLQRLSALPPAERFAALSEKAAAQPDAPRWQLALSELDLAAERPVEAVRRATAVLVAEPENVEARCVRGLGLAATGACAPAVDDLDACPRSRSEPRVADALLSCQASLGRWREAAAVFAELPPEVRRSRPLARLERRVQREVARLPAEPAATAVAEDAAAPVDDAPDDDAPNAAPVPAAAGTEAGNGASPAAPAPLSAAARARLDEARRQLEAATRAAELQAPLALAREVADAHPGSREAQHLVAEIAYRASRWSDAATYFRRGGEPQRPELRFYLAVALYESGERQAAAEVLERALPDLPRSPFVTSYVERIRAEGRP